MFRLFIFFSILGSVLNEIYSACADDLEIPPIDNNDILGFIYNQYCAALDMSDFNIGNRSKSINFSFDANQGLAIPGICLPYKDKSLKVDMEISDQCRDALKVLKVKYSQDHSAMKDMKYQIQEAVTYLNGRPEIRGPLGRQPVSSEQIQQWGVLLGMRNGYFTNYIYSRLNNLGNCGQIAGRTLYEFSKINKFSRMSIVAVKKTERIESSAFGSNGGRVKDHAFFVINGSASKGTYKGVNYSDGKVPDALLDGWICDPWRRDVRFGTVRDLANSDPFYNLANWDQFEIKDMQLPDLSLIGEISWFEKIDFMSSPDLFIELIMGNKKLWKNMILSDQGKTSEKTALRELRAILPSADEDWEVAEHPDL